MKLAPVLLIACLSAPAHGQIGHWKYDLQPLCFRGKVLLDDGSAGRDASVACSCRGARPLPAVRTQSDGRFSACVELIGLGARVGDCTCSVTLKGYRRAELNAGNAGASDQPDLGTIFLFPLAPSPGGTVSAASLAVPNDARKALEKGRAAARKQDFKSAERELLEAVKLHPEFAEAWHQLGVAYRAQQRDGDARSAFERAVSADPKYLPPQHALAALFLERQQWNELAAITARVLELDRHPSAYLHHAIAHLNLGNLDTAENSARQALRLDTEHRVPAADLALGLILAQKTDYAGAAERFRNYLERAPGAPDAEIVRTHLKNAERLIQR